MTFLELLKACDLDQVVDYIAAEYNTITVGYRMAFLELMALEPEQSNSTIIVERAAKDELNPDGCWHVFWKDASGAIA